MDVVNPLLFTRALSMPIFFSMREGKTTEKMRVAVAVRGGVVEHPKMRDQDDTRIRLADPDEFRPESGIDAFSCAYVDDCIAENRLLPNLRDYRLNEVSFYQDYDPFDVLTGRQTWGVLTKLAAADSGARSDSGEEVSDLEGEDLVFSGKPAASKLKVGRMPYTKRDQQDIVDWLVKHKEYNRLKGVDVWKLMENSKVGSTFTHSFSLLKRYQLIGGARRKNLAVPEGELPQANPAPHQYGLRTEAESRAQVQEGLGWRKCRLGW